MRCKSVTITSNWDRRQLTSKDDLDSRILRGSYELLFLSLTNSKLPVELLVLAVKWSRGLHLPLVYDSSPDSPLVLFAEAGWESKEERPLVLYDEPEFSFAISNLTTPLGREAVLSCVVDHLGKYRVSGSQYIYCHSFSPFTHFFTGISLFKPCSIGWSSAPQAHLAYLIIYHLAKTTPTLSRICLNRPNLFLAVYPFS